MRIRAAVTTLQKGSKQANLQAYMNAKQQRNIQVAGVCLLVLVAVFFAFLFSRNGSVIKNTQRAESLDSEVSTNLDLDETTIHYFENRIAVGEAAVRAREEVGQEDLFLIFAVASDASFIGDNQRAKEYYETYLQVNPINFTIWTNYAGVLEDLNDLEGAELAYLQAIDIQTSEDHFGRYLRFLERNNSDESRDESILETLELALATFGQKEWILTDLASWYEDHGECRLAIDHYEVAEQLNPTSEHIQTDLARVRANCSE